MYKNLKLTLNIYRIVDGGAEEIVFSQRIATEEGSKYPLPNGYEGTISNYSVPIAFTDLISTTGVPIEYVVGYTYEASSPSDPGTGQDLDFCVAAVEVNSNNPQTFEPRPTLIQERMDTPIAPVYPAP